MASRGSKPGSGKALPGTAPPARAGVASRATKPLAPPPAIEPVPTAVPFMPDPVAEAIMPFIPLPVETLPDPVVIPAPREPVAERVADTSEQPVAVPVVETPVEANAPAAPVVEPQPEPAAPVTEEIETMENQFNAAAEATQADAKATFAEVNDRARTALEKSTRIVEELTAFSKGNVEALVESGKIAAKGFEAIGQNAAEYGRKQFEGASAALRELSSAKSPTDFFRLQGDYLRSAFDSVIAETSKNTESVLKLAGEVAQPISNRVALAAEKARVAA